VAFAWDEGEGDRTRADWLTFDTSRPAVFERFTLVWPAEYADPQSAEGR
jgi:hypothetical protein